jgi:glyoxylase-like metal-dependent hydrolase (beta-lactamase superfamily II)
VAEDRGSWTKEGAFEVAAGVHRIPLPLPNDGLRAVNVYAVADGDRVVLIDAGWALDESREQLARSLDAIGFGLEHISTFLVTHAHRDHYTQAIAIRRLLGTKVALGLGEKRWLEQLQAPRGTRGWTNQLRQLERAGATQLYRTFAELPSEPPSNNWEDPDTWLTESPVELAERKLTVVATPGHTRGHIVFRDEAAGLLFAGDHVLPHITPSIGYEGVPSRSPLADYMTSLALMRSMPDALLLPAHGPASASVHDRVDELLHHHARRLDATLASIDVGGSTAFEVGSRLRWTRRERQLDELDAFNQMMAIIETAAHLDVLVERGLITSAQRGPVTLYLPR